MRTTFLATADVVCDLLADERIAAAWAAPSALAGMSVGGLAAHTARAVLTVDGYLAATPPDAGTDRVDAAGYLLTALPETAPEGEVNRQVLARAEDAGHRGPASVHGAVRDALAALGERLATAPPDRTVAVLGGIAIALDDYLATRVLELVVHVDDLVASVADLATPALPEEAEAAAVGLLAETARRRHGTRALVTQLARGERAPMPPPRAF